MSAGVTRRAVLAGAVAMPWLVACSPGMDKPAGLDLQDGTLSSRFWPGQEVRWRLARPEHRDGTVRHDLGLYEAMYTGCLAALYLLLYKRNPPVGTYSSIATLTYGPVRFGLDFLRATDVSNADPRYFGLTPAQYGCILVTLVGVVLTIRTLRGDVPAQEPLTVEAAPPAPAAPVANTRRKKR